MKRLFFLALLVFAGWWGWKHYGGLQSGPMHLAVVENHGDHAMERVRVLVGGQTLVREVIEAGATAELPFHTLASDGSFELRWFWRGREGEPRWSGGEVSAGPMAQRYHLVVMDDNGVICSGERIVPGTR